MIRKILAVVIALLVGSFVIGAVQALGHSIYPLPAGADPEKPEDIAKYVQNAPFMAIFFVIIAYGAAALVSGFLATLIANVGKKFMLLS